MKLVGRIPGGFLPRGLTSPHATAPTNKRHYRPLHISRCFPRLCLGSKPHSPASNAGLFRHERIFYDVESVRGAVQVLMNRHRVLAVFAAVFVLFLILLANYTGSDRQTGDVSPTQSTSNAHNASSPTQTSETADAVQPDPASGKKLPARADMVTITSVNIADRQVLRKNKPVVVSFSAPMVEKFTLGQEIAEQDSPFQLDPPVEGKGQWVTVDSFAFVATKGFLRGKEYSLRLKDDLKALNGKPVHFLFSFRTEATKLSNVSLGTYDATKFQQLVYLDFNFQVTQEALREHLLFTDGESGEVLPYEFSRPEKESTQQHIVVDLGKQRAKLLFSIRPDEDDDTHLLGFNKKHSSNIILPSSSSTGVAQVEAVPSDEPSPLLIRSVYCGESGGRAVARFYLKGELAKHEQKEFIKVAPDLPYSLEYDRSEIVFRDKLEPGTELTVTLLPGLTDSSGLSLKEERTMSVRVPDRSTAARFTDHGNLLTPVFGSRIGVDLVNVDQVNIQLYRQYDNNLQFMSFSPEYMARNMMRDIAFKSIKPKGLAKNEIARRAIDLEELTKGKKGVFRIELTAYKQRRGSDNRTYMSYENSEERYVVLSDIGLTTRVFPSGITVFASSISSASPLPGAVVKVYSRSNQLIAQGVTGSDGVYTHRRGTPWDQQLQPNVVTAQTGEGDGADLTFLPLDYDTRVGLSTHGSRSYLDSGYEAFLYPPRGVFRPGEEVDIKAFVRDAKLLPPAPFPVYFTVMSSRNTEVARGSVTLSKEGGADFSFTLPRSAPTGNYTARLHIPGQTGESLGQCGFAVEDFVPPRLEVEVAPKDEKLVGENTLEVDLSGQYLFGAPGVGLAFELGYRASTKAFAPDGYEGYVFGNHESKFSTESKLDYITGTLDEQGLGKVKFAVPDGWTPPAILRLQLILSVKEDGGRWVSQSSQVDYFPTEYLLGLRLEGNSLSPGKPGTVEIAAVTPDGQATKSGALQAEVFLVQGNWHSIYRNGRYVYDWSERLIPQTKLALNSIDGKGSFSFTPGSSGRYLVRVASSDGEIVASRRFGAWGYDGEPADEGSGRMDLVDLSFDKTDYLPGEIAKLSVKAPYPGTLFLGIERGEQMYTQIVSMPKSATVVEIPVAEEMSPNATVTAWVIRPVQSENREWYSHRAYGSIPLALSKAPHTLDVTAGTPERALPSTPLSVPFTVVDHQGTPVEGEFSVALIDEGILSLTAFKTPDPVAFFMAKRFMVGTSYDAFDALLRPEAKGTTLLKAGGDGGLSDYQGSLSTEQIFLTAYLPKVRTDANGQGVAEFDIPEYSGKGRLMIIGASASRFASASSQVRFARDVVMEAAAPRAVAPGDSFKLSLKLFTLAPSDGTRLDGNAKISVSAEGPLALTGDVIKEVPLAPEGDKKTVTHLLDVAAGALQESGVATITVAVEVPDRDDLSFSKTLQVVVRPPYPRTSAVTSALLKGGEKSSLSLPGEWLPGGSKISFSVDQSPVLAILPSLQFLVEYPYGCLEQTVSRAWPYLTLVDIQKTLHPDKDESGNINRILANTVSRVCSMMTSQGGFVVWPGYTRPDPWRSVNAAFFLVEAKARVAVAPSILENVYNYLTFLMALPEDSYFNKQYAYSTKAFAAFVLTKAGKAPLGWLQTLSAHEKDMFPSGRIFLAGAKAIVAGNPDALKALDKTQLNLGDKDKLGYNMSLESNLRNRSLLLYFWSLVAPNDKRTTALCLEVAEMLGRQRWFTTQDAGMAALALGTYLDKTGASAAKPYTATVSVDGKEIGKVKNGTRLVLGDEALALKGDKAPVINLAVSGEGTAYFVYSLRGLPMNAPAPVSSDLAVGREWFDSSGKPISLSSGPVRLKQGERVTVKLSLRSNRQVADLVVSDLLPGGMEVENPRLKTSSAGASGEDSSKWGMYIDQREDRLLVFFDQVSGLTTYSYTMRAVSKGSFVLPPLAAEGMYAPEINAITSSGRVVIE